MYFLVYKITNLINKKIYIGVHKTIDKNDSYMGSGKGIKEAIKKYGRKNFKKTIIKECKNQEEMFELEASLVTKLFVSKNTTYNQKVGGYGGFDHIDYTDPKFLRNARRSGLVGAKRTQEIIKEKRKDPKYDKEYRESMKKFEGKKHTDQTKNKIGKANSIHQLGKGNSQYGTCWIMNKSLKLNKKIKKEELSSFEEKGWIKGRKSFKEGV